MCTSFLAFPFRRGRRLEPNVGPPFCTSCSCLVKLLALVLNSIVELFALTLVRFLVLFSAPDCVLELLAEILVIAQVQGEEIYPFWISFVLMEKPLEVGVVVAKLDV